MKQIDPDRMRIARRHFLQLGGAVAFAAALPHQTQAAGGRDPRFVTIVLRGALDGLSAVPPIGDPGYAGLRGGLAEQMGHPLPLDGFFGLHPAMPNLARQYRAGQALIVHATASPYRERSHFDGQDVLESGHAAPGHTDSGWLNRMTGLNAGKALAEADGGLAVGRTAPLIMRGNAPCLGWAPSSLTLDDTGLPPRLLALYQKSDKELAEACAAALRTRDIASGMSSSGAGGGPGDPEMMTAMAEGAAHILVQPAGPRIAGLAFEGWDTHASEVGTLKQRLGGLDRALAAFEKTLGPAWQDTAILVITEFGRTAAINGTNGTDHGTATTAFLTGGAVKGGRVIADWPGLKTSQLYQNRDLNPTTDLRAVAKGIMQPLFDTPESAMSEIIFPDSADVKPLQGLIA